MTRAINLDLTEASVRQGCETLGVRISMIEMLDSGGVRLVCLSADGAAIIRRELSAKIIAGRVERSRIYSSAQQTSSWIRDPSVAAANRVLCNEYSPRNSR